MHEPNDRRGITPREHALNYVDAAVGARLTLEDVYAGVDRNPAVVAQLHQDVGVSLKLAGIYAELETAAQLERIARALEPSSRTVTL